MNKSKTVSAKVKFSTSSSVLQAIEEGLLVLSYFGNQEYYECTVCQRGMCGSTPARDHLNGMPHMKVLQDSSYTSFVDDADSGFNMSSNGFDSLLCPAPSSGARLCVSPAAEQGSSILSSGSLGRDTDTVGSALKCGIVTKATVSCQTVFTCTVCDITCSGIIPMKQHLCGESHYKKLSKMSTVVNSTSPLTRSVGAHTFSSPCDTSLTVLPAVPKSKESSSASTKRGIVQAAIMDRRAIQAKGTASGSLTCKICNISCSGDISMSQHLKGNTHRKMSAVDTPVRSAPQVTRPLESQSVSSHCNTSLAALPDIPSSIESHNPLSIEIDASSSNKDFVQTAVVDGAISPGGVTDTCGPDCEVCQHSCSGAVSVKQSPLGNHQEKEMSPDSTLTSWQSRSAQLVHKTDRSVTPSKGKATKKRSQKISKNGIINNEPGQLEGEPCGVTIQQGTKTDLTILQHCKDLPEEIEIIVSALGNLKETVNDLHEKFTGYEVMIKKHDERLSSIEFNNSQIFARQDSEIGQLTEKCAIQDRKIAALEEQINSQNSTITELENLSTIKDNQITDLLKQMKQIIDQHITSKDEADEQNCSHAC